MKVLQKYYREQHVEWMLRFTFKDDPQASYSFKCDEQGNIIDDPELEEFNKELLQECRSGKVSIVTDNEGKTIFKEVNEPYIQKYEWPIHHDMEIECDCGNELTIFNVFTNECEKCGRLYNNFGTPLAPISQWGEY